ncbi:uncharacterized protein LOC133034412 [Cannabis sativa]|uniref:uncharacterized protein LOC133034412 n=1 Tax=Cannabis sativa TaxID=3483 RepID=UPI0029CA9408|nr:uncharacterized protein LOC133034412 [Cannabis sativa]
MDQSVSFSVNNNNASIHILNASNYKTWKRDVEFTLGIMDMDLCLREEKPAELTDSSTAAERTHHAQWEKSSRLSLLTMKRSIPEHLLSGLPDTTNAKEFFNAVEKLYDTGENAEAGHLMDEMTTIKYDELKGVRDFILKLVNVQSKLKDHNIPLPDSFIIHRALHALPASFSLIKTKFLQHIQSNMDYRRPNFSMCI